jgi:hypothetical protein
MAPRSTISEFSTNGLSTEETGGRSGVSLRLGNGGIILIPPAGLK